MRLRLVLRELEELQRPSTLTSCAMTGENSERVESSAAR